MKITKWVMGWSGRLLFFLAISLYWAGSPGICGDHVHLGIRISSMITDAQLSFVNARYEFVLTEHLGDSVRAMVQGPRLFLYRSIQGTWSGFRQFDWSHINACENMFCHHQGKRIKTIFNSWLMNGADIVDASAVDAMNHWINYYAVTASRQVYSYHYDGLFIDCASHRLWPGIVNGQMPDDYSDEAWKRARYTALAFIKGYFPDKPVGKKPAETRMGKGKGSPEGWVCVIKPGRILYEIEGVPEDKAREAFLLAAHKLPFKTRFVSREEIHEG